MGQGLDGFGSGLAAVDLVDGARASRSRRTARLRGWVSVGPCGSTRWVSDCERPAVRQPSDRRRPVGSGFEVADRRATRARREGGRRNRLLNAPASLGRASLYAFYDIGAAWKRDVPGRESAAATGFGFIRRAIGSQVRDSQTAQPRGCRRPQGPQAVRRDCAVALARAAQFLSGAPQYGSFCRITSSAAIRDDLRNADFRMLRPYRTVRCWCARRQRRSVITNFLSKEATVEKTSR